MILAKFVSSPAFVTFISKAPSSTIIHSCIFDVQNGKTKNLKVFRSKLQF